MASSSPSAFTKNWLQPPHSGYHWDGTPHRFFEGWYFRLTLPADQESIAFMYSLEDPIGGQPCSGGTAQLLGPQEAYVCRTLPDVNQFWTWRHHLGLGYWRTAHTQPIQPPFNRYPIQSNGHLTHSQPRYLDPNDFTAQIHEGFQVTATLHQGHLRDPVSNQWVRWRYQVEPLDAWGDRFSPPRATAGWLSYLPIFEPGWQVLMAHGLATGWLDWYGQRYEFTNAPTYAEKNWGGAFPEKWFWIQCNGFETIADLSLTAVGSWRQVLGWREQVGLIGIHYRGKFYEFAPWNSRLSWQVAPWGYWKMLAENRQCRVEVEGWCDRPPTSVRVPSTDGMIFACQDTTHGHLTLKLWENNTLRLAALTQSAGLEVGGGPWLSSWSFQSG